MDYTPTEWKSVHLKVNTRNWSPFGDKHRTSDETFPGLSTPSNENLILQAKIFP